MSDARVLGPSNASVKINLGVVRRSSMTLMAAFHETGSAWWYHCNTCGRRSRIQRGADRRQARAVRRWRARHKCPGVEIPAIVLG